MGMYTGLHFKGIVKEKYREDIEKRVNEDKSWHELTHEIFKDFGTYDRADFIPNGMLMSAFEEWEEIENVYNVHTGEWTFACSLKNYGNEIEEFIEMVPEFIESVEVLESRYEEFEGVNKYIMKDGRLTQVSKSVFNVEMY